MKTKWNGKIYSTNAKKKPNRIKKEQKSDGTNRKQKDITLKPKRVKNYTEFK